MEPIPLFTDTGCRTGHYAARKQASLRFVFQSDQDYSGRDAPWRRCCCGGGESWDCARRAGARGPLPRSDTHPGSKLPEGPRHAGRSRRLLASGSSGPGAGGDALEAWRLVRGPYWRLRPGGRGRVRGPGPGWGVRCGTVRPGGETQTDQQGTLARSRRGRRDELATGRVHLAQGNHEGSAGATEGVPVPASC